MKKRIMCLLVSVFLSLSIIGCKSGNTPTTDSKDKQESSENVPNTSEEKDYLTYCGEQSDIFGKIGIAVYENKELNEVIYVACAKGNSNTSVYSTKLTVSKEISNQEDYLTYCGEQGGIFSKMGIAVYEDKQHNKIVTIGCAQGSSNLSISVTDKDDVDANKIDTKN